MQSSSLCPISCLSHLFLNFFQVLSDLPSGQRFDILHALVAKSCYPSMVRAVLILSLTEINSAFMTFMICACPLAMHVEYIICSRFLVHSLTVTGNFVFYYLVDNTHPD